MFNPRTLIVVLLCSIGASLGWLSSASSQSNARLVFDTVCGTAVSMPLTVTDACATPPAQLNFSSAVSVSMGVLLGDINGNGAVSNGDVSINQAQVGTTLP